MSKVELKFNLELIENIKQITTKLPHLILAGFNLYLHNLQVHNFGCY